MNYALRNANETDHKHKHNFVEVLLSEHINWSYVIEHMNKISAKILIIPTCKKIKIWKQVRKFEVGLNRLPNTLYCMGTISKTEPKKISVSYFECPLIFDEI